MKVPFMDLSRMHEPIKKELEMSIAEVMNKGNFILGKQVEEFEKNFAEYCGVNYGAGISTGTDALELILRGLKISLKLITINLSFEGKRRYIKGCIISHP